ncbi:MULTISPECIES: heavy-metal-associated domain-containing protein [unclassified Imperialibacter]|uniref:heavy-metal-associated domain-containing protein n=1 Tax=unclassified Imperialibacter TaxID=2629706 RepID=UPI001252DABF|nr:MULTISPECIES: heavy-metal-associated domain-containing protein [unclassified Imperialibacter]CAD5264749.1 Copper chaperone [Imperialibacter sp. 89]CAD5269634.1 Copper chaperone [Imperialibacter sp. 75]VVT09261.1 Heavy metal transport/detoxification protein [Imperialibacter sp. EC-SDR9]
METLKFKSNIKCTGCIEKVTPFLNEAAGAEKWEVDLKNPEKILTVHAEGVTSEQISQAIQKAGYVAEVIS